MRNVNRSHALLSPLGSSLRSALVGVWLCIVAAGCPVVGPPPAQALRPNTVVEGITGCGDADIDANPNHRCHTFRAFAGVSMGGGAAARLTMTHPELVDVAGVMGTPLADTEALVRMLESNHLSGFCTLEQLQQAVDNGIDLNNPNEPSLQCGHHDVFPLVGDTQHSTEYPAAEDTQCYAFRSDYHHWYRGPEAGRGGSFVRSRLLDIVFDFVAVFGNPFGYNTESPLLGVGVPASWYVAPGDEARRREVCATPIVVNGVYHREYNPTGTLPAVTFCDGNNNTGDVDPAQPGDIPFSVALAVDINRNGRKDYHEPVMLHHRERFADVGIDGVADESEPGYNALTNRDPAGDNYDPLLNPTGTERDTRHATQESFDDDGLDGVPSTNDYGEGNGTYDVSPGLQRWIDRSPAVMAQSLSAGQAGRLQVWIDAGLRDFLNSAQLTNSFYSVLKAKIPSSQTFTDFSSLPQVGIPGGNFLYYNANYGEQDIGQVSYLRYGDPEVCPNSDGNLGSGNHVGSGDVVARIFTLFSFLSARIPAEGRDASFGGTISEAAPNGELTDFAFLSNYNSQVLGRSVDYGVLLPPDYFLPQAQNTQYPVLYFFHGQGQNAADMVALGLALLPNMQDSAREDRQAAGTTDLQRAIIIWVDGACGPSDCYSGNFYADFEGTPRDELRFEQSFYELIRHVESTYRTRTPELLPVAQ
jgi:hypothetical protein